MPRRIRVAAHVLLFVVAVLVFYVGLGIGLQYEPALGTILWVASAAIVALNLLWMRRTRG